MYKLPFNPLRLTKKVNYCRTIQDYIDRGLTMEQIKEKMHLYYWLTRNYWCFSHLHPDDQHRVCRLVDEWYMKHETDEENYISYEPVTLMLQDMSDKIRRSF